MKPTELPMEFPEALTASLEEAGVRDVEFAAAIGVSQATVIAWKKGKKGIRGRRLIAAIKILPGLGRRLGLQVAA